MPKRQDDCAKLGGPILMILRTMLWGMLVAAVADGRVWGRDEGCRLAVDIQVAGEQVQARLLERATGQVWANGPYCYWLRLQGGAEKTGLTGARVQSKSDGLLVTGVLAGTTLQVTHRFVLARTRPWVEEQITVENRGRETQAIDDLAFGLRKSLDESARLLHWNAVPFRRQADGKLHDYSTADLVAGRFSNSGWRNEGCVAEQQCSDAGKLRSEAWAWTDGRHGLLVAKYNQEMIECSVAAVEREGPVARLRFGGAGLALYREPRAASRIAPGERVVFGTTRYVPFEGDWRTGYELYREFLNERGHGIPPGYKPPLNWNELFDVGWYHSDRGQLFQHYTREALMREAAKAKDIGCDLLYLDPGWEICEGTTLWDEERLGKVADFARELKQRFGLGLGYRTIGRVYREEFPKSWHLRREGQAGDYHRPAAAFPSPPEPVPLATANGRRNLSLLPEARAVASSVIAGYPELHQVAHLNDGFYNNLASWVSAADPSWVQIDLGGEYVINEIALGSEHDVSFNDRAISKFEVRVDDMQHQSENSRILPEQQEKAAPAIGATTERAGGIEPIRSGEVLAGWRKVFAYEGKPLHGTTHFRFEPARARRVRVSILAAEEGTARIDELEIYEAAPTPGARQPVRRSPPKTPEGAPIAFWEVCTQSKQWQEEKLKRILAVTGSGVEFMMFDEFDWRGPCFEPGHGHPVPSTPEGHVRAVYGLIEAMRARYPQVLVEAHDPVWPWGVRYLPTYFHQGFARNRYQENWGFEFMWNPIEDLRSGRALCLYYYNLGCDIPLYDHITMEGDNDACLAFWWYASTVRHLGIGGKKGLNSAQENETRYSAYKQAVAAYNRLRPFFARGHFVGLDETAHLHLHPSENAAVLNVFNLTEKPTRREVRLSARDLGWSSLENVQVTGAEWQGDQSGLTVRFEMGPMSPALAVLRQGATRPSEGKTK